MKLYVKNNPEERKKEKIFKIYTYSNLKQFELDSTTTKCIEEEKESNILCIGT